MGRAKKGPKFAVVKKMISSKAIKKYAFYIFFWIDNFILFCFNLLFFSCFFVFSYKEEVLNPKKKDLTKENLPRNV